jgi:hypothetical protein
VSDQIRYRVTGDTYAEVCARDAETWHKFMGDAIHGAGSVTVKRYIEARDLDVSTPAVQRIEIVGWVADVIVEWQPLGSSAA